ncbi:hypothetical protein EZV62_016165 [Acer yangbiense]|uniref:Myb-like domain-containing protein n=1 Tax=Acer yangbiense TaxID=1000413 RepID=A0A5C7HPT6_9ROSI|nr:hypothetical protein EZV62_016165 [Acer yangbiense]
MEMEDHQHHHDYGMADLRQLMNGRPTHHFPGIPQAAAELFPGHRNLTAQGHHYEMLMVGRQVSDLMPRGLQDFNTSGAVNNNNNNNNNNNTSSVPVVTTSVSTPSLSGLDGEAAGFGGDGGTGRWPRQETLTLLEIRSRLDSKFKEANQKGPLWDEVSRIMSEEHGYQRSGKKCREKFENLYKYYKKTKEGKAGRQDGKNYRFFRQLEALYGDTNNSVSIPETHHLAGTSLRFHTTSNTSNPSSHQEAFHGSQKLCDSLSLSNNSSELDSSSSDDNDLSNMENDSTDKRRKRRGGRGWKVKIKEFIDSQMKKLMDRQEVWLEKLTKTLEQKEQERVFREEEWRRQEEARIDGEHKFWAKERAWIEARDTALMETLNNLAGSRLQLKASSPHETQNENGSHEAINNTIVKVTDNNNSWEETEITRLIQLRTSMEQRFQQSGGCSQEALWEEIAAKLVCLGYDKNGLLCREKWDSINHYLRKTNKKRKENSRNCGGYFPGSESLYNQGGGAYCEISEQEPETVRLQPNDSSSSPSNSNVGNAVSDSCFRYLMVDGENLWENYALKLSKGDDN